MNNNQEFVNEKGMNEFINKCHSIFPTMVAGVLTDRHGFPIASKIHPKLEGMNVDEQLLCLEAVAEGKRTIVDTSNYHKIVKSLSRNVNLMLLLDKTYANLHRFKQFKAFLADNNPV